MPPASQTNILRQTTASTPALTPTPLIRGVLRVVTRDFLSNKVLANRPLFFESRDIQIQVRSVSACWMAHSVDSHRVFPVQINTSTSPPICSCRNVPNDSRSFHTVSIARGF